MFCKKKVEEKPGVILLSISKLSCHFVKIMIFAFKASRQLHGQVSFTYLMKLMFVLNFTISRYKTIKFYGRFHSDLSRFSRDR